MKLTNPWHSVVRLHNSVSQNRDMENVCETLLYIQDVLIMLNHIKQVKFEQQMGVIKYSLLTAYVEIQLFTHTFSSF